MEELDVLSQSILYQSALRGPLDHFPSRPFLRPVVGHEERRFFPSQPLDDDLPQLASVAVNFCFFIHIADLSFCSLGLANLTLTPRAVRQLLDSPQHGTAASPDGDKSDL